MAKIGNFLLFAVLTVFSGFLYLLPSTTSQATIAFYTKQQPGIDFSVLPMVTIVLCAMAAPHVLVSSRQMKYLVVLAMIANILLHGLPCIPSLSMYQKQEAFGVFTKSVSIIGAGLLLN